MTFLCGWFVLLVFTTPASVYVEVLSFFLVVMMPAGFFIILMSLHAAKLKQPSAWTLLAGLAVLLGTGFFDLYTASHRLWAFGQLSPLGFLVFVMCMAWGLGKRFADSLRQEKILSRELNLLLEKQRRFSDSLEVRVLERTQELTETNKRLSLAVEEANRASRAKTDFLAMMSHEIRTPMNAIVGMSEILETTELSESQKEYLSTIRTATDNLLVIINDILDFSPPRIRPSRDRRASHLPAGAGRVLFRLFSALGAEKGPVFSLHRSRFLPRYDHGRFAPSSSSPGEPGEQFSEIHLERRDFGFHFFLLRGERGTLSAFQDSGYGNRHSQRGNCR